MPPWMTAALLPPNRHSKVRVAGKPGLFLCGSLMGLTDISEAMTSGIAAAGEATKFLTTLGLDTDAGGGNPRAGRP